MAQIPAFTTTTELQCAGHRHSMRGTCRTEPDRTNDLNRVEGRTAAVPAANLLLAEAAAAWRARESESAAAAESDQPIAAAREPAMPARARVGRRRASRC